MQAAPSSLGEFMKGLDVAARRPRTIGATGAVEPPGTSSSGRKAQAMIWDGDGVNRESLNRESLAEAERQGSIRIMPTCDPNRVPSCWVDHGDSTGPQLVPVEPVSRE
jgi:hypothetical protein